MFRHFFSKKRKIEDEVIVSAIVTQTSALINDLHHQMDLRFKELSAQVREIELGLVQMETKLLTKDLKDKQAYGLLHYKLHEAKNQKLSDDIKELEASLNAKKSTLKDH
jgi:hypothetical protein